MRERLNGMGKKLRWPTYAEAVATLALFIALGGVSYAAIKIPKNSVGTKQLKKNAVNSAKVKNSSLLAKDFKKGQIPSGATGPEGAQGLAGTPGSSGPTGAAGATGNSGPTGPTGVIGTTGTTGPSTTAVSSGAVTTLSFDDEYFAISGVGSSTTYPGAVSSLSPSTTVTASNLSVKFDMPPDPGSRTVQLIDDGNPVLSCSVFFPDGTTCSSSGSAVIDPGSVLYMKSMSDLPNDTGAQFGFTLGP